MAFRELMTALRYPHKGDALRYILRQPSLLLGLSGRWADRYYGRAVRGFFGDPLTSAWRDALPEDFRNYVVSHEEADHQGWRMLLYLLVRKYRPKVFVETGVWRGASSAYILAAMRENGVGKLYSIDLPPPDAAVEKSTSGLRLSDGQNFITHGIGDYVPDFLRDRWELILGDANKELPALLSRLKTIDVFFHDSLHTYDHMSFEFKAAWPHLVPGGWMLSHDVVWNAAWSEFTRSVGVRGFIYHSLGMFQRPGGAPARP